MINDDDLHHNIRHKLPQLLHGGGVTELGVERLIVFHWQTLAGTVTGWADLLQCLLSPLQLSLEILRNCLQHLGVFQQVCQYFLGTRQPRQGSLSTMGSKVESVVVINILDSNCLFEVEFSNANAILNLSLSS